VAAARDAGRHAELAGPRHRLLHGLERVDAANLANGGLVQLRVDVVYDLGGHLGVTARHEP
jgi:hypothetical protein